jgi:hypothetical protein
MIIRGYKYVISGLLTCISLLLLAGCQEETVNGMSAGEGRLVIAGLKVDVGVEDVATRSELTNAPSLSDLTIKLTDKNDGNNVIEIPASTKDTVVPVGSYTLSASYGENVCGTTPYFYGSTDVEIQSQGSTTATLSASLQSAIVHPIISESLQQQFKSFTLHVKCENADHATIAVANAADYFVPSGKSYTLSLAGTNQIGESKDIDVYTLNSATAATRYNITCDPTLPSFTMPTQAETNAWSTFINITPMTTSDISSLAGLTADKIISNAVYEASANGTDWTTSTKDASGNYKISGLKAGTTYTLRSRFGGVVSSNTVTFTTENGTELAYGDMETWERTAIYAGSSNSLYSSRNIPIYSYSLGNSSSGWATRNTLTTDGAADAKDGNGTYGSSVNIAVYWRWHSNSRPYTDSSTGSSVAEISNLAFRNTRATFTNQVIGGSQTAPRSASDVATLVKANGTVRSGFLCTGSYDKSSDNITFTGISHDARPLYFSFDYKYTVRDSENGLVYAKLYDSNRNVIATTEDYKATSSSEYVTVKLEFTYSTTTTKAAYIGVMFKSSENDDAGCDLSKTTNIDEIDGSYDAMPYPYVRVAGSQLYIDNVKLIYE